MKRISLFLVLSLFYFSSVNAQQIQSLTVIPANPTDMDFITVDAEVVNFPSGGCASTTYSCLMNGFRIEGFSFHQLGPLAFICSSTDNFIIGMLQAGTYTYIHDVSASNGGSDIDSIQFTVTTTTGSMENARQSFAVYPQPASDLVNVKLVEGMADPSMIEIIDMLGRTVYFEDRSTNFRTQAIDVSDLESGLYHLIIRNKAGNYVQKLLVEH